MASLSHSASLDISNYVSGINKMKEETSSFSDSVVQESEKMDGALRKFGLGLATYFTIDTVKNFTSQLIRVRGEFQQLEIGLTTMLGSRAKADALMADIVEFATKTPFEVGGIAAATKQLIAYGVASEEVVDIIRRLGDISSGLNIPLQDLSYLYGTTLVQGRLYAQDMMQFSNRGIPLIQELSKQFNVSTSEVKELVSQGKVGFPEVQKAIKAMTDEGGRFAGLTEKNSQALTGLVSNLEDAIQNAYNNIGKQQEGVLTAGIKGAITLVENYETIAKAIGVVIAAVGTYKAALIAVNVWQKAAAGAGAIKAWFSLAASIRSSKDAMVAFNLATKANPLILVVSILASAAAAFYLFNDSVNDAEKELTALEKVEVSVSEKLETERAKIDTLTTVLDSNIASLETKKKALSDLNNIIPSYRAELDKEGNVINSNTQAIKDYLVQLEKQIRLKAAQEELEELYRKKRTADKELSEKSDEYWNIRQQNTLQGYDRTSLTARISRTFGIESEDKAKEAMEAAENSVKDIEAEIQSLKNEIEDTTVEIEAAAEAAKESGKTYAEQLADAEANVRTLKQEIKDLRSGKTASADYAKDIAEKTKALREAEAKVQTLTGKKLSDGGETGQSYVDSYAEALKRAATQKSIDQALEQLNSDLDQKEINLMEEGEAKKLRQIQHNYSQRVAEIARQEANLLRMLQDQEREQWEAKNPDFQKKNLQFKPTITVLPDAYKDIFKGLADVAKDEFVQGQEEILTGVLAMYKSFNVKREDLESKFNSTVSFLDSQKARKLEEYYAKIEDLNSQRTSDNAASIDAQIAKEEELYNSWISKIEEAKEEAKTQFEQGLQDLNAAEAQASSKNTEFFKSLYGNYSQMGYGALKNLREQAKQVLDYLSGSSDVAELTFISKEQLDLIKKSPAELENLREALEKLLKSGSGKYGDSTWGRIFSSLEDGIRNLKNAKGFDKISGAIGDIAGAADAAFGEVSNLLSSLGETEAADAVKGAQQVMGAVSNIGKGFAEGGWVGGIAAAAGEAINFATQAFSANARHKEALKAIMNEAIAQQRAYNLLLLEQNLLYEQADTIFGVDAYAKAANAVLVMKDAHQQLIEALVDDGVYKENNIWVSLNRQALKASGNYEKSVLALKDAYAGLADIEIKTGHKKTGLFGWGSGKDIYSSVLEVYPELISANGEFNKELAETIINTRTMSDEDKAAMQSLIDLAEMVEEAYEELNNYFSDIFGTLGDEMLNSIVTAFQEGESAADSFYASVSSMLENLAKQMIYSVTLGPLLEKSQQQMLDVMATEGLTDEQKFSRWTSILDSMLSEAVGQQELANSLLTQFQNLAEEKGFDIFGTDYKQTASTGGYQTMSQETGDALEGRFTAIQMNTASILASVIEIQSLIVLQINHLASIEKNTRVLSAMALSLENIDKNTENL